MAVLDYDLIFNYLALATCILTKRTPEMAFAALDGKSEKQQITKQDVEDMIKMKKAMTYHQIGEIYGLTRNEVLSKIQYATYKAKRMKSG